MSRPGAPLHDKSVDMDGFSFPAVDLAGKPRVVGRRADVGCFEGQSRGFALVIR